jgi:acid phosphatase family membrane protein YuiD
MIQGAACLCAGKQAEVLNILLEDVVQGHPVSEQRLKEVLGHTPLQVWAGLA